MTLSEHVEDVFDAVKPFIEHISSWPTVNAPGYVVVVDIAGEERHTLTINGQNKASWPAPFDELAAAKADLSERTGLPSREVVNNRPDLLQPGEPLWYGSAIDVQRSVVVGASGGPEPIDELICDLVLGLLIRPQVASNREQVMQRGLENFWVTKA